MPEPFCAEQRLGHEGGVPAVLERELLDGDPVGHAVVGHLQRVGVADVDLVLGRADLVVAVLDVDPERLERDRGLAAHVRAGVERRQVEVAADCRAARSPLESRKRKYSSSGPTLKVSKPRSRARCERAAQDVARVALIGRALGREDVAEHPPDALLLGAPRQHRERRGSGIAIMSDSSIALKPVIEEPSKPIPDSNAPSSSFALIENDFSCPSMSVNHRRMKRISRSATIACTSCAPAGGPPRRGSAGGGDLGARRPTATSHRAPSA